MVTKLVAELLGELKLNVREIHSRKPQSYRTRVSDEFRKSKGLILVTSDVSARGVDYPDVTLVVQVRRYLYFFLQIINSLYCIAFPCESNHQCRLQRCVLHILIHWRPKRNHVWFPHP